jgi:hypothetical protein
MLLIGKKRFEQNCKPFNFETNRQVCSSYQRLVTDNRPFGTFSTTISSSTATLGREVPRIVPLFRYSVVRIKTKRKIRAGIHPESRQVLVL